MPGKRRFSWADGVALVSGLGLLGFAVERARRNGITYDEALTYLAYVLRPVRFMFTYNGASANNHVLNSLAIKPLVAAFGPSELVLRLPNLAGFAAFLLFSWLLLRRSAPPLVALGGFLAISANPPVLEYFSIARGYGLALGLAVPGLFFLAASIDEGPRAAQREWIGFALLALAAIASFTDLVVFAAAGAGVFLVRCGDVERAGRDAGRRREAVRRGLRSLAAFGAVSAGLFAGTGLVIVRLVRKRMLYYGGHTGFWRDTVGSLVDESLTGARYAGAVRPAVLALAAVVFAVVAAGAVAAEPEKAGERPGRSARLLALIAVASVGISLSQHFLFGSLYLQNRTALFFIPLFGVAFTLTFARFTAALPAAARLAAQGAFFAVGALCAVHLLLTASIRPRTYLPFDVEMLRDLDRDRTADPRSPVRLGVSWNFEPQVNYYRATRKLDWLLRPKSRVRFREMDFRAVDYCFASPGDRPEAERNGFVVLAEYAPTGNALLRGPGPAASGGPS